MRYLSACTVLTVLGAEWRFRPAACLSIVCCWILLLLPAHASMEVEVYFDPQQLDLSALQKVSESLWSPASTPLYPEFHDGTIWLRLQRSAGDQTRYWLWLERGPLKKVCLHLQHAGGLQSSCQPHPLTAEPSFLLEPEAAVYFVEVSAAGTFLLPWKLLDEKAFQQQVFWTYLADFLVLGALLAIAIFNLSFFVRLKDRAHLYFVGYLLTMAAYWFGCFFGYSRFLPPNWRLWLTQGAELILVMGLILAIRACIYFMNLQRHEMGFRFILLRILKIALGLTAMVSLWLQSPILWIALYGLMFLLTLCFMWILVLAWYQGVPLAGLYSCAWFLILIGIFLTLGVLSHILPYISGVFRFSSAAFIMAYLLISLALSEHILDLRKERENILQVQKDHLEARVMERTQALEQALAQLEANNRFKSRLFSIVAHDLRSPLANLSSLLALVSDGTLNEMESRQMMLRLQRQTESLLRSLDNLLHWSQDQLSGQEPRKTRLVLDDILLEIYQLYLPVAQQKGVQLELRASTRLISVGEPDQIRLMVRNLVNNAIKFTPSGQAVILEAEQLQDGIEIRVKDQGIGMTAAQLANLFDRETYQVRAGTEGEKGLGLGLELCQKYAQHNGGELWVESQLGLGSRFVLRLPMAQQTSSSA